MLLSPPLCLIHPLEFAPEGALEDLGLPQGRVGEGNDTPLQYPCLENPMDEGAWYAAVHGVAKSRA